MSNEDHGFTVEMKDFLARLGMSAGNAPGSWSVIFEPSKLSGDIDYGWVPLAILEQIINESTALQLLDIGTLFVIAAHLRQGHGLQIEEQPVDLGAYARGEKKIFYGVRMGVNILYCVVTTWPNEGLLGVFKARSLLDNLVKGDPKSNYISYLPGSRVVESAAEKFGLQWVKCRHEEYYNSRQFKYVSIQGQLLEPDLKMRVYLFDKQESLDWIKSSATQVPEDEQTETKRIMYRIQGRQLLVFIKDLTEGYVNKTGYDIQSCLDELSVNLQSTEFDLSTISVVTSHKVDPDFEWRHMLGRI